MNTVTRLRPQVKPSSPTLTDAPQVISARTAGGLVRRAKYCAVYVTTSEHGAADILNVSKARILRMLRRRVKVWASTVFGTIIIGRPEPI